LSVTDTTGKTWYYVSTSGGSWLTASPTRGRTPGTITVSVNAYNMSPGTYSGMVKVSTSDAIQTTVTVTLNVTTGGCVTNCGGGGTPGGMYAQPYVSNSQSGTLAAAWVNNMGATPLSTTDPLNRGLVLSKAASAPADALAGATIQNVTGMNLTELGFYLRTVTPCGPDSPQFLVVTTDGVMHTVGSCIPTTTTIPSPAPAGWLHLQFDPAKAGITTGVQSISLVIGKGSTPPTGSMAVIDNIEINGVLVGKGGAPRDE